MSSFIVAMTSVFLVAILGVALILVTLELPLAIWIMKGFMVSIQIWRQIILPQIRPALAALGMFRLIPILIFFLFTQKHLINIYGGGAMSG